MKLVHGASSHQSFTEFFHPLRKSCANNRCKKVQYRRKGQI